MDRKKFEETGIDLCPKRLPRGMGVWIRDLASKDRVLLYKHGGKKGFCYSCGREVRPPKGKTFAMNRVEATICPHCGKEVIPILEGSSRWNADYIFNVATVQPGKADTVWIRLWHLNRVYGRLLRIQEDLNEVCRWGINGRQVVKWQNEINERMGWSCMSPCIKMALSEWTKMGRVTDVYDGPYRFFISHHPQDSIQAGPLQFAEVEKYMHTEHMYGDNVIRYLVDFARYPAFEKIDKAGFEYMACCKIAGVMDSRAFSWSKETIDGFLHFPLRLIQLQDRKMFSFQQARGYQVAWREVQCGRMKETDVTECAKKVGEFLQHTMFNFEELNRLISFVPLKKAIHYAERSGGRIRMYLDYLDQAKLLNMDLQDEAVLYPKNLTNAHTRTTNAIRYKEDEKIRAQFDAHVKILQKYVWENEDFLIRPAASQRELIDEGDCLGHCVGGYAGRMAKKESAIFFVRRLQEPDTPYFTLELRNRSILQCRTKNNRSYESEPKVHAFCEEWLERIVKGEEAWKREKSSSRPAAR